MCSGMANTHRSVVEGEHEKRRAAYEESMERRESQVRAYLFIYKPSLFSRPFSRKVFFVNVVRPKRFFCDVRAAHKGDGQEETRKSRQKDAHSCPAAHFIDFS